MSKKKTTVKQHPKQRASGRFDWRKHEREIERLERDQKKGKVYASRTELENRYKKAGYKKTIVGADKGQNVQYAKQNPDHTQDHMRLFIPEPETIIINEHTDLVSPFHDPIDHVITDCGTVRFEREAGHNENRSKTLKFKKRVKT